MGGEGIDVVSEITTHVESPGHVLRRLADKMDAGDTRSFYLFTVSKDGLAANTLFVDPYAYQPDLMALGNGAVDLCERIDKTLKKGGGRVLV